MSYSMNQRGRTHPAKERKNQMEWGLNISNGKKGEKQRVKLIIFDKTNTKRMAKGGGESERKRVKQCGWEKDSKIY